MRRHIYVTDYDRAWPNLFLREKSAVWEVLGSNCAAIHHVGSTAVPGMVAKPTIDLLVEVCDLDAVCSVRGGFDFLGYDWLGECGIPNRIYLVKQRGMDDVVEDMCHVHVFEVASPQVTRHLAVRDYLRAHVDVAGEYGELKRGLAERFPYDPDGYRAGKDAYVRSLERAALAWSAARGSR